MRNRLMLIISALVLLAFAAPFVTAQTAVTVIPIGGSLAVSCAAQLAFVPDSAHAATITCQSLPPLVTATPTNTPPPGATATPTNTPTPGPAGSSIWVTPSELAALPMSGTAWSNLKAAALGSWGSPNLADLNSNHDVFTLAGALYAMRTGDQTIRAKVASAIVSSIGTESGSRALEISRNLRSYVLAADIIHLQTFDPAKDAQFRAFITEVRTRPMSDGKSIASSNQTRPNNWGLHAGATLVAIDRYIGDTADLARVWNIFQGWLGDRSVYAGFTYGELSWQCTPSAPVGINPPCTKDGHDIGGILPDDQRRSGSFTFPFPNADYVHEGLQGALRQADVLQRAGYPAFAASGQALLRAEQWGFFNGNVPSGDDLSNPFIVNHFYGSHFAADPNAKTGKNGGWEAFVYGP